MNQLKVLLLLILIPLPALAELHVTIVQGLGGNLVFDAQFTEQRHQIYDASITIAGENRVSTFSGDDATRKNLLAHFSAISEQMSEEDRMAIYLIGHGSYDGEQYKFNIPGPDITDADLDEILGSLPGSNHFLVNTSSASGSILDTVEFESRILITATRNGNEKNATEFGAFFAESLSEEAADINKNSTISIQEAFDYAERRVAEFFESEGRLATEHPQIRGDNYASFSLARLGDFESSSEDPRINSLLTKRLELDAEIESLQLRRNEFTNADYIERLQALILESAQVSEQIDMLGNGTDVNAD
jgi:hypothetical protein